MPNKPKETIETVKPNSATDVDSTLALEQSKEKQKSAKSSQSTPFWNRAWFHYLALIATICGIVSFIVWIVQQMPPPDTQKKFTVLVPLASNSSEWNKFMQKNDGTYEERYNNQASQNIRDIVKLAKTQWVTDNKDGKLKEGDIEFFCFPEGFDEDETSYQKAFNHAVEITKKNGREIIGLLGNVSSTSTSKYGNFCGKREKEKDNNDINIIGDEGIPMILPLATATSLMRTLEIKKVPAVLRLPPANDKQAESISNFLLEEKVLKTVILKDLTNETYSSDLIENVRENYVQKPLSAKSSDFGEIVGTIPIGGKETSPFLYTALSGETNALIIAGMTNSAIETLAQAKASNSNFKAIVLTDGAVDEYLGKRVKKIQNENTIKNLYLSFPSPCSLDNALVSYLERDPSLKKSIDDFKFTHSLFVADGVYIIMSALDSGLNKSETLSGSQILINYINGLKQKAEETEKNWITNNPNKPMSEAPKSVSVNIKLPFNDNKNRDYLIDKFGNNINASYYLFQLDTNSNWIPLQMQSGQNCFNQNPK